MITKVQRLVHAQPQVAAEILALSLAAYKVEAALIGAVDFPPLRETRMDILQSPDQFFGHRRDGELAGAIQVEQQEEACTISRLVVSPRHFRQGIGRALLAHVLEAGGRFRVQTALKNKPVLTLYEKHGFQPQKTWQDERTGIVLVSLEATMS